MDVGFVLRGTAYKKWMLRAITQIDALPHLVPAELLDCAPRNETIERVFWPLKVRGADIPSYIIPIRPHWAAQMFDSDLASRDLFGARVDTALPLETVYYSSSTIIIPEGARILWYVSDSVQEVRAASIALGTARGSAKELFRRFSRLGIYSWADLMKKAVGQIDKSLHAYRFAYTERLPQPVPWAQLQAILGRHMGHGNPIAGPLRISEQVFFDAYRTATGL